MTPPIDRFTRRAFGLVLALGFLVIASAPRGFASEPAPGPPHRIVSLAPNLTEILFAIGAGGQLAGDTDFCDYPAQARDLPHVGGFVNPNPETVLALAPDLVVATPNVGNRAFVERLMRTGSRVEILQARNLAEIFPAIETLGRVTGHEREASALGRDLQARIARLRADLASLPAPRVLLCIQVDPVVAAGPGSYPNDLVEIAGGRSIVPRTAGAYPSLSLEEIVRSAPDIIVQTRMDTRGEPAGQESLLAFWGRWPSIPAVAHRGVHVVPGDAILRPGPRAVEGIELLARLFHPAYEPAPAYDPAGPRAPATRPGAP
jgi:iron complex transport system substrate-binding protein